MKYLMTLTSLMKVLKTSNSLGMFSNSSALRTYKSFSSALEMIARRVEYPQESAFFKVVVNCSTVIKLCWYLSLLL